MNMEDSFGPTAAALALQDLTEEQQTALEEYSTRVGMPIDCLDHVDPIIEPTFTIFRQKYSYLLSGGHDGAITTLSSINGLFALE